MTDARERFLFCRRIWVAAVVVLLGCITTVLSQNGDEVRNDIDYDPPSVGISKRINDLILPGSELTAKPIDDTSPIIVRIVDTRVHGTAFRYDLVYYGLEPGDYDLRDFLARIDGGSTDDLPPIEVKIIGVLPSGQVVPNDLRLLDGPRLGGYRLLLWVLGICWVVGLLTLVFWPRRKSDQILAAQATPITLADRLRPMVESAVQGTLADHEKAELERLLLAFWHDKLEVGHLPPAQAIQKMRQDTTAGRLIKALEEWLHSPNPATDDDINELLEPYRHVTKIK